MAKRLLRLEVGILLLSQSDDWFFGASLVCDAGEGQMANPQFVNLKLAAASPLLLVSSLPTGSYARSARLGAPDSPRAEWAAEAISNLRHVVAGIGFALIIEGAVALCIVATWNLWHIR
ncbi:MAG: hypothetical protein ACLPLZ_00210 [Terracidiphilus sp.]|jgi:hypothetical protein